MVNPNRFYTYAYLREDRTPYYIGKGAGKRIYSTNRKGLKPPKDKSRIIFLKQNLTEEEAFKHEKYMIAVFGRKDLGTGILHNKTDGGEGASGISEETRLKMSEKRKGRINSEETKIKIGKSHKGKIVSEETRRKMSESHKGNMHSEETKRKMSEALKGENNPNYGKCLSSETRRKLSEVGKGRKHSEETKRKMSEALRGENHPFYGKLHSKETIEKLSRANKDKKWWNDGSGNTKFSEKCPGEGWVSGRGKFNRKQVA